MEELEPWNMFTNDFVAEDADANELLCEYAQQMGAEQDDELSPPSDSRREENEGPTGEDFDNDNGENGDDDGSLLVPEITMGGNDADEDESNGSNREDEPGEDDSTIFNFGLESQAPLRSEARSNQALSAKELKELEMLINYENAVVYICPACGSEFKTQDLWKKHLNGVHSYNTRQGLNFVRIDKLYHECNECNKHIAMHSMENLLKHKYTHLPYRCSKCIYCQRQYKYRQDLLVHLRAVHYDELISDARQAKDDLERNQGTSNNGRSLEIKDIKENAVDIFENTGADDDAIPVKNELMEQDDNIYDVDAEPSNTSFVLPGFLEDALSRGSSHNSDRQSNGSGGGNEEQSLYEKQIQYICPECSQEYGTQMQWQQHIVSAHNFGTREGLNFEEINSNQQARCLECDKIIAVNVIHHLQQHKFTHLPNKSWLRCKLCFQAFVGRPEILRHLMQQHRLSSGNNATVSVGNEDDEEEAGDSQDVWDCDDSTLTEDQRRISKKKKSEERDKFEKHIDYLCPTCGQEFRDKKLWRKHIVNVHKLTSLEMLNFKNISDREVMCLECAKVITNAYGIQNAQQHYFTHMPFKSFIRCRLCSKTYTDRKGLVKHLRGKHFGRMRLYNAPTSTTIAQKPLNPLPTTPRPNMQPVLALQPQLQSNLLSRALQRPLRGPEKSPPQAPPPTKLSRVGRHKEIVTRNNVVFEIEFLDDEDDEVGVVNTANNDDDDVLLVPELSASSSRSRDPVFDSRDRCADCGSIFINSEALRKHIRSEHDFYERPRPFSHTAPNNSFADVDAEHSNEDALLVPSGVTEPAVVNTTATTPAASNNAEIHFTYLCPACGVENYTQVDWRRHINEVHNFDKRQYLNFRQLDKYRFQCTICQDVIVKSKLKTFQDHKFRHLPYKSYLKCKHCGTLYNHKPNMYGHLQVRHNIYVTRPSTTDELINDGSFPPKPFSKPTPPPVTYTRPMSGGLRSAAMAAPSTKQSTSKHSTPVWHAKPPGLKTPEDVITFHNAVDHASITYFCPACNENFDSHVFWRKHIVEEHNLNSREGLNFRQIDEHHFLCLQCYKRVTVTHTKGAIGQLQSHKFRHLPYKSFKCLTCNGEFVRKQMFFKHLNRATNSCEGAPQNVSNSADCREVVPTSVKPVNDYVNKNTRNGSNVPTVTIDDNGDDAEGVFDNGTNAALIMNQDAFVLVCPQCGQEFDSQRLWREHINVEHGLGKRETLHFKKIKPTLHKCVECGEYVNGRKLRDLQIHRFKHLPYGPYIQCKFCKTGYNHIRNMQDHLRQKHPNVVQKHDEYEKMEEMRLYEESSLPDSDSLTESSVVNEAEGVDDDDDARMMVDDLDDDEQYLLG